MGAGLHQACCLGHLAPVPTLSEPAMAPGRQKQIKERSRKGGCYGVDDEST